MDISVAAGVMIPFIGTTLGSAMVFFMRNQINKKIEKLLMGFAAGVMVAASVWSLLIPAIDMAAEQGKVAWIPAAVGFILGMAFLLLLDSVIPHLHLDTDKPEGMKTKVKKTTMMVFAVTLHNIPEGMAVGVTFAGALLGDTQITMAGRLHWRWALQYRISRRARSSRCRSKVKGLPRKERLLTACCQGLSSRLARC